MAILDKSGNISGAVGPIVYRSWRGSTIIQCKPKKFRQTLATKESSREFGLICTTARVMRQALSPVYEACDGKMINRFNSVVSDAVRNSPSRERGERDLHDGDLRRLEGFEFNTASALKDTMANLPESGFTADGKLLVRLPAQQLNLTIRGASCYTLRMMVTAFNFREEWYKYVKHEDIVLKGWPKRLERREWLIEDLPAGCVAVVSFSMHAEVTNGLGERKSINSAQWSPAAITGAYVVPGEPESAWKDKKQSERHAAGFMTMTYFGNQILATIPDMRKKHIRTRNERTTTRAEQKPGWKEGKKLVLPKGKISFSK